MPVSVLGRNLRRTREERGWSRATLARKSGVSEPTIIRVELYSGEPRVANLVALARALGVDVENLLRPPVRRGRKSADNPSPAA